jgi:membrane protease YdiL (CAAX protease family)
MYFVNRYIDRNSGLAIYGATSLAASYGAGIAEEYMFRNAILPLWDYKYGQKKGLIYSSLLFGSMHFSNLLFSNNPDYKATLFQVGEASILGYLMGRDVQNRGYNIGPSVAAHMWYDFTLMLGSFLIDPKNNFLGVDIKFKIQ